MKIRQLLMCGSLATLVAATPWAYTLDLVADHGDVRAYPQKADYDPGEIVRLIPQPDTGFSFSHWGGDASGKRLMNEMTMDSDKNVVAHFEQWSPPIGIPLPQFGIVENHTMYEDQHYDFGSGLEPYRDAGNGPYTHYVNSSHPQATDVGNTFGTDAIPRATFPDSLTEGSVVEIHNGPYEISLRDVVGTVNKPIFVRGTSKSNKFSVNSMAGGSYNVMHSNYLIVEHAVFTGVRIQVGHDTSHISFRHCEIDGNETNPGVYLWTHKATYEPGDLKEHIVFYDNEVHDCGVYPASSETYCAFMIDDATQNVWIVDSHIYENGEDGVHILDRDSIPYDPPSADRIFVGRNVFHHDIENAIDIKGSTNVIVSQNEMYGYDVIVPASNGDAVRVNDEGAQDNIWILFNRIFDSKYGIGAYGAEDPPYIIGNLLHDLEGAVINGGTGDVIGNVVYSCGRGIEAGGGSKTIANNIVAYTDTNVITGGSDVRNNLFWQNGEVETCVDCVDGNPLFAAAAARDFKVEEDSPAIDQGSASRIEVLCTLYSSLYGVDLRKDFEGVARPQGSEWDIGAHEFRAEGIFADGFESGDTQKWTTTVPPL
ncbi:MAG: right-handed parallel beta-helix repeat-containing protein [bacterium]|nr:right-handed parallel beta-helix repeat-containing protein [bacterium]